jgi:hypothetical protein
VDDHRVDVRGYRVSNRAYGYENPVERMNMVVKGEPERMRTGECMPKGDRDDCTSS